MSIKIVLIGAGGYAATYIEPLLENRDKGIYEFSGIVDINLTGSPYYRELAQCNIPMYHSLEDYFVQNTADLVIVGTPTHFHKYYSLLAVNHGANVLCEKPIAPLYEDAIEMLEASKRTGKFIAISYQWSYSDVFLKLKQDIMAGVLGKPLLLKAFVSRPRDWDYFSRGSGWAGKMKDDKGNMILDSVVSNSTAHYLHNMYFLLGEKINTSAFPKTMRSELYRANNIENFDTCILDIQTQNDVRLFYVATHAANQTKEPIFQYQFENAIVTYGIDENHVVVHFHNGEIKDYGDPNENYMRRLWDCVDAVVHEKELPCTVETALAHTLTVDALYQDSKIHDFPIELINHNEEKRITTVNGLYEVLKNAYETTKLLTDRNDITWAKVYESNIR